MGSVFLDLDGTLVNSQGRLYRLFRKLCPECHMSYDEYWTVKRTRISQAALLKKFFRYDDDRIRTFHKDWLDQVEDEVAVETDSPVEGVSGRLSRLAQKHDLFLLTARQKTELVVRQIAKFGWNGLFRRLIVTRQACDKSQAVKDARLPVDGGVLIGDTGEDVLAARQLGMKSVAVGWGILSPEVLREYNPDYLAERMEDLDNCPFI